MYSVFYTSAASRQLRRLPRDVATRILIAVESFTANPRTPQTEKLEGASGVYRLRIGDYRVLYTIDDALRRVVISRVRHRRDAYR